MPDMKRHRLENTLLPILQCINCRSARELHLEDAALICPDCGRRYPLQNDIPILLFQPEKALEYDQAVVAEHPYSEKWLELIERADGKMVLDLGSGNNASRVENVIKLDVFSLPNVDVVGLAENLPFRDAAFHTVFSGAVFEHVFDPFLAIDEVDRVLKNGGHVYIETAFLQPVHAFPSHYFNMTCAGLELICADFEKIESGVQPHQYPSFMLKWVLEAWSKKLPQEERKSFLNTTVGEILEEYDKNVFSKRWLENFTEKDLQELACGVYYHGRKSGKFMRNRKIHPTSLVLTRPAPLPRKKSLWKRMFQRFAFLS